MNPFLKRSVQSERKFEVCSNARKAEGREFKSHRVRYQFKENTLFRIMKIFVGTSGWYYDWNEDRNLDWYIANSGLNAVELNASFYRFPFPNMVSSWAKKGKKLNWVVKVNRLITHVHKFGDSLEIWEKFYNLFSPLNPQIKFYLFQLPPSLTPNSAPKIESFVKKTKLGKRFALEARNAEWFGKKWVDWAAKLGITLVSVDSPEHPRDVFNTNGLVYVRMHGRSGWYSHYYSDEELREVKDKILEAKPKEAYIFFNNDHAMLENARRMLAMFSY